VSFLLRYMGDLPLRYAEDIFSVGKQESSFPNTEDERSLVYASLRYIYYLLDDPIPIRFHIVFAIIFL